MLENKTMTTTISEPFIPVADLEQLKARGCLTAEIEGRTVALFWHDNQVYAVDNRCPHMGFPLHQGSLRCGILTCHWHHARFDLATGGTFDLWADDVTVFPTRIDDGKVWVDIRPAHENDLGQHRKRLEHGLKHNLRLVIAKAVLGLEGFGELGHKQALEVGAELGTRHARDGWNAGLTIFTAMANILPTLEASDRPLALYHGLGHIAPMVANQPPLFLPDPLPQAHVEPERLKAWFREFIEVRDSVGAMRVLHTAIVAGHPLSHLADMIFAAATDHLYLSGGHALDFANKAFELLQQVDARFTPQILLSVVPVLANGQRSEESASWRHPIDLAHLLTSAFAQLPEILQKASSAKWQCTPAFLETLLGDDPVAIVENLQAALLHGATFEQLAGAVALAAAHRIAYFRTSNEFSDWITVLHSFTYANAVHQAMRRAPSLELLRGVFDGALSVYLARFLNTPPAPLPRPLNTIQEPLTALLDKLNSQNQVEAAAQQVMTWLVHGGSESELLATLGRALLREDAEFHTYQMVEAGFRQYRDYGNTPEGRVLLVAMARYLAAHCPTARANLQTYQVALRLHRGENLYTAEDNDSP
jgi:nitrite reductase/ring-hydroxylating ferredoxin subunit